MLSPGFVYGPVPSRRLGRSLGIDPVPIKTCNWNCVYCQLGRTSRPVNARREYVPAEQVVAEVAAVLAQHSAGEIDWITFVGSGEPTLHARLGWMIREVKLITELPIAVITNGSLLSLPAVREELLSADAVLPSLDAGCGEVFLKINRPHPSLRFQEHVNGLAAFSRQYHGRLWVEVMLIDGFNDSEGALSDLAAVLRRIRPDEVHLNLPVRPPCEPWVKPTDEEGQMRAVAVLGDVARVVQSVGGEFDLSGFNDIVDALLAVVTRHPMRQEELVATLERWSPNQVGDALARLCQSGRVQVVERFGHLFWCGAHALYVDKSLRRYQHAGQNDKEE